MRSSNEFTKNRTARAIIPVSSNTASKNTSSGTIISVSSNAMSGNKQGQIIPIAHDHGWEGENLTSNEFGFDEINSGIPFGLGEFGGIKHFENIKDRT